MNTPTEVQPETSTLTPAVSGIPKGMRQITPAEIEKFKLRLNRRGLRRIGLGHFWEAPDPLPVRVKHPSILKKEKYEARKKARLEKGEAKIKETPQPDNEPRATEVKS